MSTFTARTETAIGGLLFTKISPAYYTVTYPISGSKLGRLTLDKELKWLLVTSKDTDYITLDQMRIITMFIDSLPPIIPSKIDEGNPYCRCLSNSRCPIHD